MTEPRVPRASWPYLAPEPAPRVARGTLPEITVVITAYNVASFLPEAIESALGQSVPAAEIIVVDDGSTDDTSRVLERYAGRVHVIRQSNGGEAAAKNTGWRAATTDYVMFLDGDDVLAPERVEAVQWVARERPDLDVIVTDLYEFGPAAAPALLESFQNHRYFPLREQRGTLLERAVFHVPCVRRATMAAIGGMNADRRDVNPDWEVAARLVLHGARAGFVAVPLYGYRRWEGQSTANAIRVNDSRTRTLRLIGELPGLTPAERARNAELRREAVIEGWRVSRPTNDPLMVERAGEIVGDPAYGAALRARAWLSLRAPRLVAVLSGLRRRWMA